MVIPINTLTDISITLTRVLPSIFWGGCVPPTIEKITICLPRYSVVNMLNMNPFHGFGCTQHTQLHCLINRLLSPEKLKMRSP